MLFFFTTIGLLAYVYWLRNREPRCGEEYCGSLRDPRCEALLCRFHCNSSLNCRGACLLEAEEDAEEEWPEEL